MKKEYTGLNAIRISFGDSGAFTTLKSGCYSIIAFTNDDSGNCIDPEDEWAIYYPQPEE